MKVPAHQQQAFDSQYVAEGGTVAASTGEPQDGFPEVETEHYGVGKPRRVVVRGKIIREE